MLRMEIGIPAFGVRAVTRLYDEYAPKTVQAVLTVLPFTGPGIHAMRSGREVFTVIPAPSVDPGNENQSAFPIPGDLYLYHTVDVHHPSDVPADVRFEKEGREYWHIAIWYGRESLPFGPTGLLPGNHFGEVETGLAELAGACQRIRLEGVREISYAILEKE